MIGMVYYTVMIEKEIKYASGIVGDQKTNIIDWLLQYQVEA
jgi:hypothetical protein